MPKIKKRKKMPKRSKMKKTAETKTERTKIDESSTQSTSKILPSSSLDTTKSVIMSTFAQDFADIRHMAGFVDKSMLIQAVLNKDRGILLTAPRRYGKSINMTMLKRFFENLSDPEALAFNRELFKDTDIEQCESVMTGHFQKYPVIYLDFRSPGSVGSYDAAFQLIRDDVHKVYLSHEYLKKSHQLTPSEKRIVQEWCDDENFVTLATTDEEIYTALEDMARFLFQHHNKKVFILVDEYDGICSDSVLYIKEEDELQRVIALCIGSLSCLLKPTEFTGKYIDRGIMTGISYFVTMGLSKLTNINPFKFQETHIFSSFYGITVTELKSLLSKIERESEACIMLDYYNGYKNDILSIWSIMNYLKSESKEPENFWKNSGTVPKLNEAFRTVKVRCTILKLLNDTNITVEFRLYEKIELIHLRHLREIFNKVDPDFQSTDVFFNLLLEQGYLSRVDERTTDDDQTFVKVRIPNREIRLEFREKLELFYMEVYRIDFDILRDCSLIFDKFDLSNGENNKKYVSELGAKLNELFKPIDFSIENEATFHHLMWLVILYCTGKCYSEIYRPNRKILDLIVIYDNGVVIIIELKVDETIVEGSGKKNYSNYADVGLRQILDRDYASVSEEEKYNPKKIVAKYFVRMGVCLHKSDTKSISLSVLLNNINFDEKINYFPEM